MHKKLFRAARGQLLLRKHIRTKMKNINRIFFPEKPDLSKNKNKIFFLPFFGFWANDRIFFPKDDNLGVLKSTATTCACVRGRVGVSECGGEVGVGSLGGSRPARNFHFRRNYTSILYLDPVPRSCTSILYPPGPAVTFRPKI